MIWSRASCRMVEGRGEGQRKNLAPALILVRLLSPLSPSRLVPDGARAIARALISRGDDDQLGVYWETSPTGYSPLPVPSLAPHAFRTGALACGRAHQ